MGISFESQIIYCHSLPERLQFAPGTLPVYDLALPEHVASFARWLEQFDRCYGVQGGEQLKDLQRFVGHLEQLTRLLGQCSARDIELAAIGGGSVGDFVGFIASIFKRGVALTQVPSTWLSAIDSAHGGKTALNVAGVKNQIGTFYPARKIILSKALLIEQPRERGFEALGEVAKTALLAGGSLWSESQLAPHPSLGHLLWELLPSLVQVKWTVVRADPTERTGERAKLNLGHSLGHVLEAYYRLPHGIAVGAGLFFSVWASERWGFLSSSEALELQESLIQRFGLQVPGIVLQSPIPIPTLEHLLLQDKKRAGSSAIQFVFLSGPGKAVVESVPVQELVGLAIEEGWAK